MWAPVAFILASAVQGLVAQSMQAMGGEGRLAAIHSLEYVAVGERAMVEQSERPTGPYFIDRFRVHEVRDFDRQRVRIDESHEAYAADVWWLQQTEPLAQTTVVNGTASAVADGKGGYVYGGRGQVQETEEQFAFAPERLLFTARNAPDVRALSDKVLHGVRHHVLAFTWNGAPCTLAINAQTNLPWQITFTRPYPYQTFLNAWGDVTTSITYNAWALEPYGISYPREWTRERVGLPDMHLAIVQLHLNPAVDNAALTVPDQIARAHPKPTAVDDVPLGFGGSATQHELAPGVTQVPGGWNVEFVKQSDGVVVIEAPWSTSYSKRIFQAARALYGLPVKAVITTSDSWPHIAGVRQAVAEGISVYALDLNRPILERLLSAPHHMRPDDLQRNHRKARFHFVTADMQIGSGPNRIVIVPYRTATAERQMMVYLPEHSLLYTSDLFAPAGEHDWFTPQYLREAISAIEREHLSPATIFGMHYDATPYAAIVEALTVFTR